MPGTCLSRPVGNAGAGSAGLGQRDVLEAGADLADVAAGAAEHGGGDGQRPGGDEHAAARGGLDHRSRRPASGAPWAARPASVVGLGGRAVRSRNQSAATPVTAVAMLGSRSTSSAAGRFIAVKPATADQHQQQPGAEAEPAQGQQAADGREHEHAAHDRADQDRLVLVAELADRPLLHRRGRQVDDLGADGQDRRGRGVQQRGDEVPRADADEGREDPEQGIEQAAFHMPVFGAEAPFGLPLLGWQRLRLRHADLAPSGRARRPRPRPRRAPAASRPSACRASRYGAAPAAQCASVSSGAQRTIRPPLPLAATAMLPFDQERESAEHLLLGRRRPLELVAQPVGELHVVGHGPQASTVRRHPPLVTECSVLFPGALTPG